MCKKKFLLAFVFFDSLAMCAIHPPRPSGPWGISHATDYLVDESRIDPHHHQYKRRISLDIWLPVNQAIQLFPYDKNSIKYWEEADFWTDDQKVELKSELQKIGQYLSAEEIATAPHASLPVVIFSHGFGAWASFYSSLIQEIVSHGIAVIGINHPYNAGIAVFPDQIIYGKMTHADLFLSRYAEIEQQT